MEQKDQLDELQKATEELLGLGARSILADAPDYTWEQARDRLSMDEATMSNSRLGQRQARFLRFLAGFFRQVTLSEPLASASPSRSLASPAGD